MDSKDYRNLLVREIKEMSLLCESLTEVGEIPSGLLLLSKAKVESMASIIDILAKESEKKYKEQTDDYQRVETLLEDKSYVDEEEFVEKTATSLEDKTEKVEDAEDEPFGMTLPEEAEYAEQEVSSLEQEKTEEQATVVEITEAPNPVVEETVVEETEIKETVVEEPQAKDDDSNSTAKKSAVSERRFLKPLKISIGDRFLYIKLFDNDANEMNKAVSEINKLDTYEEALDYLSQYQWDEENEGVNEFYKLLKAHFS